MIVQNGIGLQGSSNKSSYSTNSSVITTSKYFLNDNTNSVFNELEGVDLELPLISNNGCFINETFIINSSPIKNKTIFN